MELFGKKKPIGRYVFDGSYEINKNDWTQVFSACLGKMVAIQQACAEIVIKNQDWYVDFDKRTILFGDDEYPVQFIGSESSSSNTWLWGWENVNGFDEKVLEIAKETKKKGDKWNLDALSIAYFDLDEDFDGHKLSIVTCGISGKDICYYRCPHDRGASFVAFSGALNEVFRPIDVHNFISLSMECIQQFELDHKIFIESFLRWNEIKYEWQENSIIAHFKQDLLIEFEEVEDFLRIKNIQTVE